MSDDIPDVDPDELLAGLPEGLRAALRDRFSGVMAQIREATQKAKDLSIILTSILNVARYKLGERYDASVLEAWKAELDGDPDFEKKLVTRTAELAEQAIQELMASSDRAGVPNLDDEGKPLSLEGQKRTMVRACIAQTKMGFFHPEHGKALRETWKKVNDEVAAGQRNLETDDNVMLVISRECCDSEHPERVLDIFQRAGMEEGGPSSG